MSDTALYIQLLFLTAILSVITFVDVRTRTIPDLATIALAACGFLSQWVYASALAALATAGIYFALFWLIREIHWHTTHRIGLGFGDVKMAGAAGTWLTIGAVPLFVGFAALTALTFIGFASVVKGAAILRLRIPFGPFLALSLLACWILKISDVELGALYGY